MKKIGIISDTHSYWDDKYLHYFEPCDEIWHAGDIGSILILENHLRFQAISNSTNEEHLLIGLNVWLTIINIVYHSMRNQRWLESWPLFWHHHSRYGIEIIVWEVATSTSF